MKHLRYILPLLLLMACQQRATNIPTHDPSVSIQQLLSDLDTLDSRNAFLTTRLQLASRKYDSLAAKADVLARRLRSPLPIYAEPLGTGGIHYHPVRPQ